MHPVVAVFCAASKGTTDAHMEAARRLAQVFHENNVHLVYGGSNVGLMGEVAHSLVELSGEDSVTGIIPTALAQRETKSGDMESLVKDKGYGKTITVKTMHERKKMMHDLVQQGRPGSGFVALTGGFGTLEEILEMTTWNQLGIHALPCVLFNVEGFWDDLLRWVNNAKGSGFISEPNAKILSEARSAEEVITALNEYIPSEGRLKVKW
ncbi:MAG: hypothetical protein M1828_002180 [Chrysothrix sp. TS-e1954]|nr:MAG: hypothetical protein M1828_002180 [Chrysothrix sp. TS-e1954]